MTERRRLQSRLESLLPSHAKMKLVKAKEGTEGRGYRAHRIFTPSLDPHIYSTSKRGKTQEIDVVRLPIVPNYLEIVDTRRGSRPAMR